MKLLLHVCCAPCSGSIIETLINETITFDIFFYNPNIYPEEEYKKRKKSVLNYAKKHSIKVIDHDYHPDAKYCAQQLEKYKDEPERGKRCTLCFELRLNKTLEYAAKNGYTTISSTLGISRWKDFNQVCAAGYNATKNTPLTYWDRNWRKNNGLQRNHEIAREEEFYLQNYCGCQFRATTKHQKILQQPNYSTATYCQENEFHR